MGLNDHERRRIVVQKMRFRHPDTITIFRDRVKGYGYTIENDAKRIGKFLNHETTTDFLLIRPEHFWDLLRRVMDAGYHVSLCEERAEDKVESLAVRAIREFPQLELHKVPEIQKWWDNMGRKAYATGFVEDIIAVKMAGEEIAVTG